MKLKQRTKIYTAAVIAVGALLTAGTATEAAQQAVANASNSKAVSANIALPPEVRQQLEEQKAALRAIYLEFTTTNRGTLPNWNYDVAPAFSASFEGSHFYRQERIPRDERYVHEVAFDGQAIWMRQGMDPVFKYPLADAPDFFGPQICSVALFRCGRDLCARIRHRSGALFFSGAIGVALPRAERSHKS